MSILGFDALGRLALGELPHQNDRRSSFFTWDVGLKTKGLPAAIIATTVSGWVPQPPPVAVAPPPVGGYFSTFSQPPPKVGMPVVLQPQPAFWIYPFAPTPGPLVFSTFVERYTKPPLQVGTWVAFELTPPFVATFTGFFPFDQPFFKTTYRSYEQPSPLFEVRLTPPPPFTSFANFGLPQQKRFTFANLSWNIDFKIEPTPFPGGGTSRRLPQDDAHRRKHRTGFEPIKKQFERPVIEAHPLPIPKRKLPARPRSSDPTVEIVDSSALPDLLALEERVLHAQDIADVNRFLTEMDADEHDAQDIADILAFLDGPQPDES